MRAERKYGLPPFCLNLGEGYDGQELIDTRKLTEGIYIFTLSQDGEKVSDGKFIIAH